jgi:hypothetical protein
MRSQAIRCYEIDEQKLSELLNQVYGKNRWKVIVSIISSSKDIANGSAKLWQRNLEYLMVLPQDPNPRRLTEVR